MMGEHDLNKSTHKVNSGALEDVEVRNPCLIEITSVVIDD